MCGMGPTNSTLYFIPDYPSVLQGYGTSVVYASAWSGFCLAADRERLDTFLRRCKRLRYSDGDIPEVHAEMFDSIDEALFSRIIRNNKHVLQHYLRERHKIQYNLRPRQHSKQLISKTAELNNRDYIVRMLYRDAY